MAPGRSRIVIIGHLGFETVQTPFAQRRGPGGSAYYTALGAALSGGDVSLVSTVGSDFSLDTLREVGVDLSHVSVARGASSRFEIKYLPTFADRLIELDLGVGSVLYVPESLDYSEVKYVHVATNLPQTQVELIERLRVVAPATTITADCFDQFVVSYPKATCRVVQSADLVFANLVEYEMIVRMCGDDHHADGGQEGRARRGLPVRCGKRDRHRAGRSARRSDRRGRRVRRGRTSSTWREAPISRRRSARPAGSAPRR